MEAALLYLLFLLVAGILTTVIFRQARPLATVVISILICVPSYFVWFALRYFSIIPVDSLLDKGFGIDSYQLVGTPLGALVLFGPPLLPSIVMLCWFFLIRRRNSPDVRDSERES
jgi:Mg2+/citrate symporter